MVFEIEFMRGIKGEKKNAKEDDPYAFFYV